MKKIKKGRTVTVIGSGESGRAAVRLLLEKGARVRCSSLRPLKDPVKAFFKENAVPAEEGEHTASWQYARAKTRPREASRSMCGVTAIGSP